VVVGWFWGGGRETVGDSWEGGKSREVGSGGVERCGERGYSSLWGLGQNKAGGTAKGQPEQKGCEREWGRAGSGWAENGAEWAPNEWGGGNIGLIGG